MNEILRINQQELDEGTPINASWHNDYTDSAYIYIGSLPFELTEGDIITIFSQFGNPVHVKLVRDKDSGKSRGFAYLSYEDQRSTVLAVDNLCGAEILGRKIVVDHTRYEPKEGEDERNAVVETIKKVGRDEKRRKEERSDERRHRDRRDGSSERHKRRRTEGHSSRHHHRDTSRDRHRSHRHDSASERRSDESRRSRSKTTTNADDELEDPMKEYFESKSEKTRRR